MRNRSTQRSAQLLALCPPLEGRSSLRFSVLAGAGALALLAGCGEWPRFSNLPGDDGHPASMDPSSIVMVDWVFQVEETSDFADLPTDPDILRFTLEELQGLEVVGTLNGGGWSHDKPPTLVTSAACPGSEAPRIPVEDEGDYTQDVDIFLLDVPAGSTLCATGRLDGAPTDVGWDLALVETLDCGVPRGMVTDAAGKAIGYNLTVDKADWSVVIERDTTVALVLAIFNPVGPQVVADYHVGVSVVPSGPNGSGICPLLPSGSNR